MVTRFDVRFLLLAGVLLPASARVVAAQRFAQTASIAVTLRVLPVASFEGGNTRAFSAVVAPGVAVRIPPSAGVRTRMTYNAPSRVVVTSSVLRGPHGAAVQPGLLCARGAVNAADADIAFACSTGYIATIVGGRASSVALGIGAEISAADTKDLPAGVYVGEVQLVATHPAY